MKLRVLVRCPLCGLSASTERLTRAPFPLGVITKWVTSQGRGTIQNHYAPIGESGRGMLIQTFRLVERVLVQSLALVREKLSALTQSPDSLTAPSASVSHAPSFECLRLDLAATWNSTEATALTTLPRPLEMLSSRARVLTSA